MPFPELVGQGQLKKRLDMALNDSPGHAYLFSGSAGSGRHSFAKAFAKALLCQQIDDKGACGQCDACRHFELGVHPDFKKLTMSDKEKNIKVERVRQLCSDIHLAPQSGNRKIYLIDADFLNEQGQNALLKSLEEPPEYVVFLLTVAGIEHLLPTVLSRVSVLTMQRYCEEDLIKILQFSGYDNTSDLAFLVRYANGLPGKALELAGDDHFGVLRETAIDFYLELAEKSRTELLSAGYAYFDEKKEDISFLLSVFASLIRDQLLIAATDKMDIIVNQDMISRLKEALPAKDPQKKLWKCYDSILAANRALSLNASFEVLICQLLLSLRKELNNA